MSPMMAGMLFLIAALTVPVHAASLELPTMPREYSAVILMKMPYIGLEMPLRVLTSATSQKIEYYNGLQVDTSNTNGTYKYTFNNGDRVCMYTPASSGPMEADRVSLASKAWESQSFFPDLSGYTYAGDELVGGIMCQKYTFQEQHGKTGTMDDHISFYWDPVLQKPVRWHMHSRHVVFGSHTDEYVMDYLSIQSVTPSATELAPAKKCMQQPIKADVSIQIHGFLSMARAMRTAPDQKADLVFDAFLKQHGRSYAAHEHAFRKKIFSENVQLITRLNSQHAGAARFKGNQFLDMTKEEVLQFRGGKSKSAPRARRRSPEHLQFVRAHETSVATHVPKNFDWRVERPGVVSPVKDQGMCGSCWTYGLTEPIESIKAIQGGTMTVLPEQFVIDCTWTNGTGSSGGNFGCDGGDSDIGALEIVRKYGGVIPAATDYGTYLSVNGHCKDTRLMKVGAKITGWVDIKDRDEEGLKEALSTKGPVSVGIMVPDEMLFYDSGVLNVSTCKHNASQIDHAVVAVGYGTDEHGTDYYTIRNSWSTYWGDQGYIKIARGEFDCAVSSEAGYPEVAPEVAKESSLIV